MIRILSRCFCNLLLASLLTVSPVLGQPAPGAPAPPPAPIIERSAPAVQYTVAMLSTMLILVIVCMPSRKQ